MNQRKALVSLTGVSFLPVLLVGTAQAHCPLCSAGAGGGAALASTLGISLVAVGVFVGAFAVATGLWMNSLVDGDYVPYQDTLLVGGIFLSIVVPVFPMMNETVPVYLSLVGEYGSVFNSVYFVNTYLVGVVVGTVVTYSMPAVSGWLSERRGSTVPFQGLTLTFLILTLSALLLEVLL